MLAQSRGKSFTPKSFSARFDDDPTISEGAQIDLATRHAGISNFSVSPDPLRLIDESRSLHWHQEEPFLSASIYLQWCVARLARDNDTTVLIDGQGADELLAGYQGYFRSYQLDCLDRGHLAKAALETWAFTRRLHSASTHYLMSSRRFNKDIAISLTELFRCWLKPPPVYAGAYEIGVPAAVPGMRLRRQIAEATQYNSLPVLLRYADRNSMAFSREVRLPFLDYELADWCISLPDQAFVDRGWQKYILRRAVEGIVPPAIQWRADKVGYAAPLDHWLRGPLKEWAYHHLFEGPIRDTSGYNRSTLESMWARHQTGAEELSWSLWRWISLDEWITMMRQGAWRTGIRTCP
jgi:asparagine synthase (glutamine-hydrolysing)